VAVALATAMHHDAMMLIRSQAPRRIGLPRSTSLLLLVALALAGCAPVGSSSPSPAPAAVDPSSVPPAIRWVRTSAEHRVAYEIIFAAAGEAVDAAAQRVEGPWGVIVDADETLLDNSMYQLRRARRGLGYTPESWNEWVREEAAPALPGAVAFTRSVKVRGGRVAVVTNRDEAVCEETRRNLTAVGVVWDVVLCRTGPSEKETRFGMVEAGTTPAGLPPLEVVVWVGDNIEDFPGGSQALRDASGGLAGTATGFGRRFFVLPNPMYGSWASNPDG
jgi:5'-nucleotidase (lipoprotein e(P4) family)